MIILHTFRCRIPQAVYHWLHFPSTCRMSCLWNDYVILVVQALIGFFDNKMIVFIISIVKWKMMFTWELIAAVLCKGRAGGIITDTKRELPTGFSVTILQPRNMYSTGLSTKLCMEHSTSLGWLKSNVRWITSSLVYDGLTARVTILVKETDAQGDCGFPSNLEAVVLGEHEGTINVINNKKRFVHHHSN